jgi:hypothetical protein
MRFSTLRMGFSTDDIHNWTPAIVGSTGLLVVILIVVNPGGIVPNGYTCIPWSDDKMTLPLNFVVETWQGWVLVNVVLFCITFYSGFIYKIWLFWTWVGGPHHTFHVSHFEFRWKSRWSDHQKQFYSWLPRNTS